MKLRRWFPLLIFLALTAGCARNYVLTLTNGSRLVSASKPRLKNGAYVYKDGRGEENSVPAMRVREIAPASMTHSDFSTGEHPDFLKQ